MESQRGKLTSHLGRLYHAVIRWLEWENLSNEGEREDYLYTLADEGEDPPEQPEPLAMLRKFRRFNFSHLMYSGGFYNQPHIFMREIHTCIEAEYEFQAIKAANLALQAANNQGDADEK